MFDQAINFNTNAFFKAYPWVEPCNTMVKLQIVLHVRVILMNTLPSFSSLEDEN